MNCKIASLYICVKDMERAIHFYEKFKFTGMLEENGNAALEEAKQKVAERLREAKKKVSCKTLRFCGALERAGGKVHLPSAQNQGGKIGIYGGRINDNG